MRRTGIKLLYFLAQAVVRKYQPIIIGITGSVGKTLAQAAVLAVLAAKFSVRASSPGSLLELRVPLTIFGVADPGRSAVKWIGIFLRVFLLLFFKARYPAMLILEMNAERPKDLVKLLQSAPPKIGVVTAVAPAHTEFFGSLKRVAVEKRRLVEAVSKQGTVILNADDEIVRGFAEYTDAAVTRFGLTQEDAEIRALEAQDYLDEVRYEELGGVHFKLCCDGAVVPVHLKNVLSRCHVYAALAAASVGKTLGMHLVEISQALLRYAPPPGRMRLLEGIKGTLLIDDTYNSSLRGAFLALETMGRLTLKAGAKRIAVLGDLPELGTLTETAHREVGREAGRQADLLLAVGVNSAWIVQEAIKVGLPAERALHFHNLDEGVEHFLQKHLQSGDLVLIQGSSKERLEQLVLGLLADPQRDQKLLCRQI